MLREALRKNEYLQPLPDNTLDWLITHSEHKNLEAGSFLFKNGDAADYMHILVKGTIQVYLEQNGGRQNINVLQPGTITGVLPYSRMKQAVAYGLATEQVTVLSLHRDHFRGMEQVSYELMQNLVSLMTSRVRDFTSMQQQTEKLVALGKLSAGLAHELNNPAAAMVRSSAALKAHLGHTPERFKAVIKVQLDDESIDTINTLIFQIKGRSKSAYTLMELAEQVDAMTEYLESLQVTDAYDLAENLIENGLHLEDVQWIASKVSSPDLATVLRWAENVLVTDTLVSEIEQASKRISELVSSVKSYSHMDRGQEQEPVMLEEGIRSTLTMLAHKVKAKKATIHIQFPPDLPMITGKAGQLNQVWTNLLDNALDAIPEGGTIALSAIADKSCVRLIVHDNGQGIPADSLSRIFEPFYTTKPMGQGTGLGLDISLKIIRAHGGDIKVKSEPGNTIFTIELPISSK
jgi:signal transduction histidine kinase